MPSSDEYQDFISYIDRDAAKVNEQIITDENDSFSVFYQYMDYMGDEKQGALFSSTEDIINVEKNFIKRFVSAGAGKRFPTMARCD